jgi:ribose 5-phosphate isomerase
MAITMEVQIKNISGVLINDVFCQRKEGLMILSEAVKEQQGFWPVPNLAIK